MDAVYSQAQLTIIAAAGSNPGHGLPGVKSRHRIPQLHLAVGGVTFVQIKYPPEDSSLFPWASRAWTYQEELLSRRKLIFTDHGVYYACNRMHGAECINEQHSQTNSEPGPFTKVTRIQSDLTYEKIIEEYTSRTLSFDSDALNACLGILEAKDIVHAWGVRMTTDLDAYRHTLFLGFYCGRPCTRRPEFPSWSWVGWKGSVTFWKSAGVETPSEIRIGDGKGEWRTIADFAARTIAQRDAGSSEAPRYLSITGQALVSPFTEENVASLRYFRTAMDREIRQFEVPVREDRYLESMGYLDISLLDPVEQLKGCIAMPIALNEADTLLTTLLLRPEEGKKTWERIGVVTFQGPLATEGGLRVSQLWREESEYKTVVVG